MKKTVLFLLLAAAVVLMCTQSAYAGEAAAGGEEMSLFDLIWAAGWIGLLIILLSVAGFALGIEHAISIRRDKLLPADFVAEVEDMLDQEEYEETLHVCEGEENLLGQMVGPAIAKMDHGYESMVEAMDEAGEESSLALHHKISYVALIATISPMLGLLGTVVGMIQTFMVFASTPGAGATELAPGISKALVTTVMGLIVAIPMTIVFQFFRNRVLRMVLESSNIASDLVRRFKPGQRAAG